MAILAFILSSSFSFSQKPVAPPPPPPPLLPIDSITKLITYEEVITMTGITASVLYQRALEWFHLNYKNPTEVIRENDSIKFKIIGKPRFRISNPPDKTGFKSDGGQVQYTLTFSARDGRYKYEISEFNWKQASYYACERWYDTKSPYYTVAFNDYLDQVDKYTHELIANLKNALSKEKPVKDKDKW